MLIGYARVSTHEQDNQTQANVLASSGCEKIYQETASGGRWDRPQLHALINSSRPTKISLTECLILLDHYSATRCPFLRRALLSLKSYTLQGHFFNKQNEVQANAHIGCALGTYCRHRISA